MKKILLLLCLFACELCAVPREGWHKSRRPRRRYSIPLNDRAAQTNDEDDFGIDIELSVQKPMEQEQPGLGDDEDTAHAAPVLQEYADALHTESLPLKLYKSWCYSKKKVVCSAACIGITYYFLTHMLFKEKA